MTRVWLPDPPEVLGGLPEGMVADVWTGGEPLPASADEVEFIVLPMRVAPETLTRVARLPKLKVIQLSSAGAEHVVSYVPDNVLLCNARGAHDAATAEWAVGVIVAHLRDFPRFITAQGQGRWDFAASQSVAGKHVLIVGYGSIGQAVERRLTGFDVTVRRAARSARDGVSPASDLPGLLPAADVVILLAPVTEATAGMVDAAFLARMKDGALLINAARGVLVVTDDLVAELRTGRLSAAMDVTDPEPLPPGHPLWALPNVLITPHVGASTPYSLAMANRFVAAQAERYVTGQPLANVITGEY